jgi:circadian clock protein KaiC
MNPYALVASIIDRVESGGHTRLVIDSLDEISSAIGSEEREQVLIRHLTSELRRRSVTSLLTASGPIGTEPAAVSAMSWAGICDTVVTLRHLALHGEVRRGLTVLKSRGTAHTRDVRPYQITSDGATIATRRVTVFEDAV